MQLVGTIHTQELEQQLAKNSLYAPLAADVKLYRSSFFSKPAYFQTLVSLRAARPELLENSPPGSVDVLLQLLRHPEKDFALQARRALLNLKNKKGQQLLFKLAMERQHQEALSLVLEAGYIHENPAQQALFLFLHHAWEKYAAFDFDYRHLKTAYEAADVGKKKKILKQARLLGQAELIQTLVGQSGKLDVANFEEWQMLVATLTEQACWDELWKYVTVVAPSWSLSLVQTLTQAGWQPSEPEQAVLFQQLSTLAQACEPSYPETPETRQIPLPQGENVQAMGVCAEQGLLAAATDSQKIYVYNIYTGDLQVTLTLAPVHSEPQVVLPGETPKKPEFKQLAISPNGKYLVAATTLPPFYYTGIAQWERALSVYDLEQACFLYRANLETFQDYYSSLNRYKFIRFSEDSYCMITATTGIAELRESKDGALVARLNSEEILGCSKDTKTVFWREAEGTKEVLFGDITEPEKVKRFPASYNAQRIHNLVFANHRNLVLTYANGENQKIELRDAEQKIITTCVNLWAEDNAKVITQLFLCKNERLLVSYDSQSAYVTTPDNDNTRVRFWRLPELTPFFKTPKKKGALAVILLEDDERLLVANKNGLVEFYRLGLAQLALTPLEATRPADLNYCRNRLQNSEITAAERAWLLYIDVLLNQKYRYSIEIEEPKVPVSKFDIELEQEA